MKSDLSLKEMEMEPTNPFDDIPEEVMEEVMDWASSKIKQSHIDTLEYMANKDGVTTISYSVEGSKFPFRPKLVLYAMRVSQGEKTRRGKWNKVARKPGSTKGKRALAVGAPLQHTIGSVERQKLIVLTDNNIRTPADEAWQLMSLRFSMIRTILADVLEGLQEHKKINDEQLERINALSETEGDPKTETAADLPGGTDETVDVREETEEAVDAGSEQADGDAREQS